MTYETNRIQTVSMDGEHFKSDGCSSTTTATGESAPPISPSPVQTSIHHETREPTSPRVPLESQEASQMKHRRNDEALPDSSGPGSVEVAEEEETVAMQKEKEGENEETEANFKVVKSHVLSGAFSPTPILKKKLTKDESGSELNAEKDDGGLIYHSDEDDSHGERLDLKEDTHAPYCTIGPEPSMDLDLLIQEHENDADPEKVEKPARPLRGLLKQPKGQRNATKHLNSDSLSEIDKSLKSKLYLSRQAVRFHEEVETKDISRLRRSAIDDLFYNSTELADFRQEAFLEQCGLDPADFM